MTTISGVIRSYNAAVKRSEREYQKQVREAAKRYKELQKKEAYENAQKAVKDLESYVSVIISLHKNCSKQINWLSLHATKKPEPPNKENTYESKAAQELNNYKPGIIVKLFKQNEKKIKKLEGELEHAKYKDSSQHEKNLKAYNDELQEWEEIQKLYTNIAALALRLS